MAMDPFDPSPYLRVPVLDVPGMLAFAHALRSAAPKNLTPPIKRALRQLTSAAETRSEAWADRQRQRPEDKRPYDLALDQAWALLRDRLVSYAALPADYHRSALRARVLVEQLFPNGLSFLTLPYESEWAESERILGEIDSQQLALDIDHLAGPDFLAEVRRCHKVYGQILGITAERPAPPEHDLRALQLELQRTIGQYALKLLASVGDSEGDVELESSAQQVRQALRPYDEFRAAISRRNSGQGAPATPNNPAAPPQPASRRTPTPPAAGGSTPNS